MSQYPPPNGFNPNQPSPQSNPMGWQQIPGHPYQNPYPGQGNLGFPNQPGNTNFQPQGVPPYTTGPGFQQQPQFQACYPQGPPMGQQFAGQPPTFQHQVGQMGYPGVPSQVAMQPPNVNYAAGNMNAPQWPSGLQGPRVEPRGMDTRGGIPTIRELPGFNAENDAEGLRKAMRGFGTDEAAIIEILSKRTAPQRKEIARIFLGSTGNQLKDKLKSELSGRFEDLCVASLDDAPTLNAKSLRKAMEGAGTKERVLIQVLAIGSNADNKATTAAYKAIFKRDLEKDIRGDASGDFQKILVALMQGLREENAPVDCHAAEIDADALHQAGEARHGTEEAVFTRIFARRSFPQICEIANAYQRKYNNSLVKAIKKETSGNYEDTMVAIVDYAMDRYGLLAKWLGNSMAGAGTRDDDLIRLTLTRADVDLESIKQAYMKAYGKSLEKAIEGDTSGDYRRLLLAIVRGNSTSR